MTEPGDLTAEYLRGRRARYISPLRLYLTTSVLFFLLAAAIPNVDLHPGAPAANAEVPVAATNGGVIGRIQAGRRLAMAHADVFAEDLAHAFPKVMFALVPIFALALQLVYRRQRRHYVTFLDFSLHLHAVIFLALAWEPDVGEGTRGVS